MSAEETEKYFHSFESGALPQISWQEMLDSNVVFAPQRIIGALREAREFLISEPGPNLQRRRILVPEWFKY